MPISDNHEIEIELPLTVTAQLVHNDNDEFVLGNLYVDGVLVFTLADMYRTAYRQLSAIVENHPHAVEAWQGELDASDDPN